MKKSIRKKIVKQPNKVSPKLKATIDDLYDDHYEAFGFAENLSKTTTANVSENSILMVRKFYADMKPHFKEEENDLFPLIKNDTNSHLIDEILREHREFESTIDSIENGGDKNPETIRNYGEKLMSHIQKEDALFSQYEKNKNLDGKSAVVEISDGKKGGYLVGKQHSECDETGCGIQAVVSDNGGKRPVELEANEIIITRPAVEDPNVYVIEGTPKEILSTINHDIGGGVKIGKGAIIKKRTQKEHSDMYESGGKISGNKYEIIPQSQTPKTSKIVNTPNFIKNHKKELNDFMEFAESIDNGAALSANQVSVNGKRLIYRMFAINEAFGWSLIINPSINEYIGKKKEKHEECLSWKGKKLMVERSPEIRVSYYNIDGDHIKNELISGYEAQVWQHEIDHLNGVRREVLKSSPFETFAYENLGIYQDGGEIEKKVSETLKNEGYDIGYGITIKSAYGSGDQPSKVTQFNFSKDGKSFGFLNTVPSESYYKHSAGFPKGNYYVVDDGLNQGVMIFDEQMRGKGFGTKMYESAQKYLSQQIPNAQLISSSQISQSKDSFNLWKKLYKEGKAEVIYKETSPNISEGEDVGESYGRGGGEKNGVVWNGNVYVLKEIDSNKSTKMENGGNTKNGNNSSEKSCHCEHPEIIHTDSLFKEGGEIIFTNKRQEKIDEEIMSEQFGKNNI